MEMTNRNNSIFIFDIDGTLTYPRQPIIQDHLKIFKKFIKTYPNSIFLITGSDKKKVDFQLDSLSNNLPLYTCQGNEYWNNGICLYQRNSPNLYKPDLLTFLIDWLVLSPYPIKTGNHIEFRTGMINISSVGRNATIEQRTIYNLWDSKIQERITFQKILQEKFPYLQISLGGKISFCLLYTSPSPRD